MSEIIFIIFDSYQLLSVDNNIKLHKCNYQLSNNVNDDLDSLFSSLSGGDSNWIAPVIPTVPIPQNEDDIEGFTIRRLSELVNAGVDTVIAIKDMVASGQVAEEMESLSSLISSTAKAASELNKFTMHTKKVRAAKELKLMDIEGRKQVAGMLQPPVSNTTNNTISIVASREEIMRHIIAGTNISQEPLELKDVTPKE